MIEGKGNLIDRLQSGMDKGFSYYRQDMNNYSELAYYNRLTDLRKFKTVIEEDIQSSGYVVHTLEASVWCLIHTDSYEEAVLKAVNLGDDTDTVGAVTGGLAGLYYGYNHIPDKWLEVIQKREWIEKMCNLL